MISWGCACCFAASVMAALPASGWLAWASSLPIGRRVLRPCGSEAVRFPGSSVRRFSFSVSGQQQKPKIPIHRFFFINLDRRVERRTRIEKHLRSRGLGQVVSRFPAVDGQTFDLDAYPSAIVTRAGVDAAKSPPAMVNGVHLTRGALGLILSYHTLLRRIASDPDEHHIYVIAEDDAVLVEDFTQHLEVRLDALASVDPSWDLLHVGYYEDDCSLAPLGGPCSKFLCRPVQVYGLFGAAFRPRGARALLESLFPLDEQIDSALSKVYGCIHAFATRPSLMRAEHSTAGNSDIQLLPEGFRFRG
eukprot:TRINITY_DN74045_c0_g1_i1.p1 TRINITY_DN74045_c0_g1~~TRINITY_DN74045_c0_g1_i1.p1  ORF type:complete len:304 (-),score=24.38 TRINITY_DN74045_c0_g1_i1:274-1185(-)